MANVRFGNFIWDGTWRNSTNFSIMKAATFRTKDCSFECSIVQTRNLDDGTSAYVVVAHDGIGPASASYVEQIGFFREKFCCITFSSVVDAELFIRKNAQQFTDALLCS